MWYSDWGFNVLGCEDPTNCNFTSLVQQLQFHSSSKYCPKVEVRLVDYRILTHLFELDWCEDVNVYRRAYILADPHANVAVHNLDLDIHAVAGYSTRYAAIHS